MLASLRSRTYMTALSTTVLILSANGSSFVKKALMLNS